MKRIILLLIALSLISFPVSAMEFDAPNPPESAQQFMPEAETTFAEGLWYIVKTAIKTVRPSLADAAGICLSVIAVALLVGILNSFSPSSSNTTRLVASVLLGILLLQSVNTLIRMGTDTVQQLSEYGKLLIPVMTAALAAQGGATSSAALYTGTVFFDSLLITAITRLIVPALYVYLCLCIANCAIEQDMLKKVRDFVKWVMTWALKWVLYIFTGYMSITGVISGAVDASAIKATKLTISGVVPVVGGILSDASETILVSAGLMKSAAGVYGIFALLAICIGPFLQIGTQYLLLKMSGGICNMFECKPAAALVQDFSSGMGLVLGMTGTVCIMLLVSLVCFMKGVG